jgi:hypothetical protein
MAGDVSRSRRAPYFTEGYGGSRRKAAKRAANKRIRQTKRHQDVGDGAKYKREYNPWDICDWKFYDSSGKARRK